MQRSAARKTSKADSAGSLACVDPALLPDISKIVIDDGKPVDNIYSERQMRLLVDSLYASWTGPGEGRPFLALANVGLFIAEKTPPLVPDVMLSLDVALGDPRERENLTYFVWVMGKLPELVLEVVSNTEGGELSEKKEKYARMGVPYYVVWDPEKFLKGKQLNCFVALGGEYQDCEPWFPLAQVGVEVWNGEYQGLDEPWLRWRDARGNLLLTGQERAEVEKERAENARKQTKREKQRASEAKELAVQATKRADALAAKLRSLGVDPESP